MSLIILLIGLTALAMVVHELGHLLAARWCNVAASELGLGMGPRLATVRIATFCFTLRVLPFGSFVRLDGTMLEQRSLPAQLFVHLGGVVANVIVGLALYGTIFGWLNLLLAAGNLLPLYQHDGWKCGVVLMRSWLRRKSQPAEWAFTFSGGFVSLWIGWAVARLFL